MTVAIVAIPPPHLRARLDDAVAVYRAMYALPEAAGPRFAAMLADHAARDGFRLVVAADNPTGQLVGLAYGFTGLPGQPWRDALAAAMGEVLARDWLDGHFELAEFGVIPARRREGLGGRLYDALLRGLPHRRAVLTVREGNDPARAFYDARGWAALHDGFVTPPTFDPPGRGPYTVMGRELRGGG